MQNGSKKVVGVFVRFRAPLRGKRLMQKVKLRLMVKSKSNIGKWETVF
jgi:hypothetical protein